MYKRQLERFKAGQFKQVVPGHGPVAKDWLAAINNAERYLNVLLADIRASIKKGESMESAMNTAAASEKEKEVWYFYVLKNEKNKSSFF